MDYPFYYGMQFTVTHTSCDGSQSCDFITTGTYPSFDCPVSSGAACTKKFTSEGQVTTVTLDPCPLGEITPPPGFPAEIIGCTSFSTYYFCGENCQYFTTSWSYYNQVISKWITSCDTSGCEIVTDNGYPSYSCPTASDDSEAACTKTFSHEDRTVTITFDECPLGEITPPPDLTIPPVIGCTTYQNETYCPDNCILSGTIFTYYNTINNYIYSVCDTSGCEFVTGATPSFICSGTPGEPEEPTPCTKTFSHEDRTTTITFDHCPLGTITPPPHLTIPYTSGCTTYSGKLIVLVTVLCMVLFSIMVL